MASVKKKGLGKGLGALITERTLEPAAATEGGAQRLSDGSALVMLDPTEIAPNPKQPRRQFDEERLSELAASLRRDGLQEPVVVRLSGGQYQLVSGERRVRASVLADLKEIPAIVRDVPDSDMLKLGLIENIQREDLNVIEVAEAYRDLMAQSGWTQEELAREVGKNRATVANVLRLLNLPEPIQQQIVDGLLTMGHARALLAIESAQGQIEAARKVVSRGLSVRQTEQLATLTKKERRPPAAKDANTTEVEDRLRRRLGTKVNVVHRPDGRGKIELEYFSSDELERLLELLLGR